MNSNVKRSVGGQSLLAAILCFLTFVGVGDLHAQINWTLSEIVNTGSAQRNTGTGFLDASGTLVWAENFGGDALTHDDIDFAAGVFELPGGVQNVFHASAPLTDTATFGGVTPQVTTIGSGEGELGGVDLVPGTSYRIQLIVMDGRNGQFGRRFFIDGIEGDHAMGIDSVTWGNALLCTGTFIATGTTQSFTSQVAGSGTGTQFNAGALQIIEDLPAGLPGDFNGDMIVDCADLDFYVGNLGNMSEGAFAQLELTGDDTVTLDDADLHITTLVQTPNGEVGTFLGDLNCDGTVNILGDALILVGSLGSDVTSYGEGDVNFDGTVNILGDALILVTNLGNSNSN